MELFKNIILIFAVIIFLTMIILTIYIRKTAYRNFQKQIKKDFENNKKQKKEFIRVFKENKRKKEQLKLPAPQKKSSKQDK